MPGVSVFAKCSRMGRQKEGACIFHSELESNLLRQDPAVVMERGGCWEARKRLSSQQHSRLFIIIIILMGQWCRTHGCLKINALVADRYMRAENESTMMAARF